MTPLITLLWILTEIGYCEGGERSVHRDGMVDQGTTGGIERRESKKREILRPEGISWETSYNVKEDFGVFPTPWLSSEGASSQAEDCPYLERIAQIIEEDKAFPKKHRHIAKRIYERIREMGYGGKYTQVKEAVRELLRMKQVVFMPLIHRVGEGRVDFGYALAKVSGEDVDWAGGKIHVRRNLYKGGFQAPKSRYSRRAIDMGPRLIQVLREYRARENGIRLKAGKDWIDHGLIFCQKDGTPLDAHNLYHRDFKRILKKAGLRHIRIHDLRHTFASILIATGHNPKYIQSQMGHASINITMDLCGHLMPEVHKGAAKRSEDFVFGHEIIPEKGKVDVTRSQPLRTIGGRAWI